MPKGKDLNQNAFWVAQQAMGAEGGFDMKPPPVEKSPAAVALGRLGGLKGGKARAASLSKKERSQIAKNAANARWSKLEK